MQKEARFFHGPYGILPTPFLSDGSVDYPAIEQMVDSLCGTPLSGIVVCGSTSEFVMLTPEENKEIMTAAANAAAGRKPLVCGATGPDSRTSLEYLEHMAKLDAAGALVAPPYYFPYDGESVLEFYRILSEADCGVRLVAYQIPAFSSSIPLNGTEELMSLPGIAAVKNSSANIKEIMRQLDLRDHSAPHFSVLTGTDDALIPCLTAGCDGSFTALAAVFPEAVSALYQELEAGNIDRAKELQHSLICFAELADRLPFPAGYKLLAEAAGKMKTFYRQPLSASAKAQMKETLLQMKSLLAETGLC